MNRRKPDNVHRLNGTYRPHRHGQKRGDGPDIKKGYPKPPAYLKETPAFDVWKEIQKVMKDADIYTQADAAKIARYCVLEAEFRLTLTEYPTPKLAQLRLMERDLYLDPESRAKLGVSKTKSANPFDQFT